MEVMKTHSEVDISNPVETAAGHVSLAAVGA